MKLNKSLNKTIALIICVIVGIIFIHNLYMYEINYGVKIGTPEQIVEKTKKANQNSDDTKGVLAVFILMNAITIFAILRNYFQQKPSKWYPRRFNFDLMDIADDNFPLSMICFFTYLFDGGIVFALISYLIYLIL